jgi:hypothetical protein
MKSHGICRKRLASLHSPRSPTTTGRRPKIFHACRKDTIVHRLECRMAKEAFPVDSELYLFTRKAYEAGHHLAVKLHYLGCRGTG